MTTTQHKRKYESPSSINCYNQCARRYWYRYREGRKEADSIHLVRGNVVHDVLEKFWNIVDVSKCNSEIELLTNIQDTLIKEFNKKWKKCEKSIANCGLSKEEEQHYFDESADMLKLFGRDLVNKIINTANYAENLSKIRPIVEMDLQSDILGIKGRIDIINNSNGDIEISDYKTSKEAKISKDYKLQMSIYSLLYEEMHKKRPTTLSVYFLKQGEILPIVVDDKLMQWAKETVDVTLDNIKSGEHIDDFPMKPTALCRWDSANGKGQCSFYSLCFVNNDFVNGRMVVPTSQHVTNEERPVISPIVLEQTKAKLDNDADKRWAVEQACTMLAGNLGSPAKTFEEIELIIGKVRDILLRSIK